MAPVPRLVALRYVQPLREGGSLPALVDTEDGPYVVKFRGAGQGPKALVAELIVGLLAKALDLPVPDLALVDLQPSFGRSEPDPEIQDLLRRSHGTNVGLRYLDGAFNFASGPAGELISADLASRIIWFDAYTTNPDRTHRNPNLLVWERKPWLIDHGSALYVHHDWSRLDESRTRTPFPSIKDHVLLTSADELSRVDGEMAQVLNSKCIGDALEGLPDDLLEDQLGPQSPSPATVRDRYARYLLARVGEPRFFVEEANKARLELLARPRPALKTRR